MGPQKEGKAEGTRIGHVTERKRRQKLAALQRFLVKLNASMELLRSKSTSTAFGKNF